MTSNFQLVNLDKTDVNFSEVWNKITVQQLFHWLPVLLWRTLELFLSFNTHIKQICRTFYHHQQVMADGCPSSSLVLQEVCSWLFPSHYPLPLLLWGWTKQWEKAHIYFSFSSLAPCNWILNFLLTYEVLIRPHHILKS